MGATGFAVLADTWVGLEACATVVVVEGTGCGALAGAAGDLLVFVALPVVLEDDERDLELLVDFALGLAAGVVELSGTLVTVVGVALDALALLVTFDGALLELGVLAVPFELVLVGADDFVVVGCGVAAALVALGLLLVDPLAALLLLEGRFCFR